jgi:uncharacterized protein YfkK (UPF0435 family)
METNRERMEARIDASNEKFEILQGTLIFQMNYHQARTEAVTIGF